MTPRSTSIPPSAPIAGPSCGPSSVSVHSPVSKPLAEGVPDNTLEAVQSTSSGTKPEMDAAPASRASFPASAITRASLAVGASSTVVAVVIGVGAWEEMQLLLGDPIVALMLVLLVTVLIMPLAFKRDV
jgi:hypothetical protein